MIIGKLLVVIVFFSLCDTMFIDLFNQLGGYWTSLSPYLNTFTMPIIALPWSLSSSSRL